MIYHYPELTAHGQFQTATQGVTVNGGNDRFREAVDAAPQFSRFRACLICIAGITDVKAG
jgi:hypothetical protein